MLLSKNTALDSNPLTSNKVTRVAVIGAGGNIGSQLVPHLGRMLESGSVLLIDPDIYEQRNLVSQSIFPSDVGRSKAVVQQARLRRVAPHLAVEAHARPVQAVPLGLLRAGCLVACLDSRVSRMHVNEIAWRMGIPWIDTAVDASGLLARVNLYVPGVDTPCLECAWNDDDYKALEQTVSCLPKEVSTKPTNAPASLGAVAAAYAASECAKVLRGEWEHAASGRQVLLDLRHHQQFVTRFRRNPRCRFDHAVWQISSLPVVPQRITLRQLHRLLSDFVGGDVAAIRVAGNRFSHNLACSKCGLRSTQGICLPSRNTRRWRACRACHEPLAPVGFDSVDWLMFGALSQHDWRRSAGSVGLRNGDVVTAKAARGEHHVELERRS